jgi:hypothetical protein
MRGAAWLAGMVLLAACAPAIEHPVPAGPAFEGDDVRFVAPTGWEMRTSNNLTNGPGRVLVYLANQPLRDECGMAESSCTAPLVDQLRTGGMLVVWATRSCAAQLCNLPSAPLLAIGNRRGVVTQADAGCEANPFTERSAYYVTVTPQRVDILLVCAREPSDATRSAFLGFLDAIQWRIP